MLASVLRDAERWCGWGLAVLMEGPALGTGSAALSVPSCTLVGHHIANGSGLCTSIISLDLLNAFTAKPWTGQSIFFLSTTQYKGIKCGSSTHSIQPRTKLNTVMCFNVKICKRGWGWISKGPSLLRGSGSKNILWKHFNPKPIYLFYNPSVLSNNGIDCVLFS